LSVQPELSLGSLILREGAWAKIRQENEDEIPFHASTPTVQSRYLCIAFAQESHLLLEARARLAGSQVQPQRPARENAQFAFLQLRNQMRCILAGKDVSERALQQLHDGISVVAAAGSRPSLHPP
jgi:hypothetical protein